MNSFDLSEQDFRALVIVLLKKNNISYEQIQKYLYLIGCGLEILKYYCNDYEQHLTVVYGLYFDIIKNIII